MSYLGNSPQTVTTVDYYFTATAGQTVFSGNDNDGKILAFELGNVDVLVNGYTLSKYDYTETTGTITLTDPRDANDIVLVRAKGTYSSTDHYTKAESPALAANNTFTGTNNTFNNINIDSINGGALSGFKNRLQNPLFQVDIEGNASGTSTTAKYVVEGWRTGFSNGIGTQTFARVTGDSVPYALRYTVTSGSDTSITGSDYAAICTAIEGYDIADALWGTANAKSIWISGRVKAPTTGVYSIGLRNGAGDRAYTFDVNCTANTWVDFEKEIPGDTGGTWEKTTGIGLIIWFVVAWSPTFQTAPDVWTTGDYYASTNQSNGIATEGNIYEIENIRVSVGGPIPTEWRPYALDFSHCNRYYEVGKVYAFNYYQTVSANAADVNSTSIQYAASKRIIPTITFSNSGTGTYTAQSITTDSLGISKTGVFTVELLTNWAASARLI